MALPSARVSTNKASPLEHEASSQEKEEGLRLMCDRPMSLSGLLPYTCTGQAPRAHMLEGDWSEDQC